MKPSSDAPTAPASLHTSARLGLTDKLKASLEQSLDDLDKPDKLGRTPLHLCVLGGHEDCCELLLKKGAAVLSVDCDGQNPLHTAASSGLPMLSYLLASKSQAATLVKNKAGKSPVDLAADTQRGEVLNALLLACSGSSTPEALDSMKALLACGAVCDTWAPNGSSALMLAAAIDCTAGVELLLSNGATLELQDALGRTALMFAAGNDATAALAKLLGAGASVSIRDRRGRNVMDYAVEGSSARTALEEHLRQLESKASQLQAALLAELCGDEPPKQPQQQQQQPKAKKSKKKKSKARKGVQAETAVASTPALSVVAEEEGLEEESSLSAAAASSGDEPTADSSPADRSRQAGGLSEASASAGEPLTDDVSSEAQSGRCRSSMEHNRSPEAGSSAGEEADGRSPAPPDSPGGWCTVSKVHSRQHSKPVAVPPCSLQQPGHQRQVSRLGLGQQAAAIGMAGRLEAGSLELTAGRVPRCPSSGSLASTCSGESHDTEASRFSGSERSVLRPMRAGCLPGQHQSTGAKLSLHASSKLGLCPASTGSKGGRGLLPPTASWASQPSLQQPATCAAAPAGNATWAKVAEAGPASLSSGCELPCEAEPVARGSEQQQQPGSDAHTLGTSDSLEAELAALREQVAALQAQRSRAELQHRQELAAVLEDAAQHEAKAVQQAVAAERLSCIVRFTSFLQQNGSTLCASFPEVFRLTQAPSLGATAAACGQDELFLLGDLSPPLPVLAPGALHIPLPQQQPSSQHQERYQHAQRQHALGFACGGGAVPRSFSSSDSSAAASPFGSVLASAANNYLGLAQSPPSTLAPLAFQPFAAGSGGGAASSPFASTAPPCKLEGWPDAGSPLSTTPLPSASFSYHDIEAQLRGEYKGNHSAFLVPAADSLSPLCCSLLNSLEL